MFERVLLTVLVVLLISCSKEEDIEQLSNPPKSYFPMTVGNYWVYEYVYIDTNGIEEKINFIDSTVITKELLIEAEKYYVFNGSGPWGARGRRDFIFLKDSSGYLIDSLGRKLFAENDFRDTLVIYYEINDNDTLHHDVYRMEFLSEEISTQAGTFKGLNYKGIHYYDLIKASSNPKFTNTVYSRGVGMVLDTYFYTKDPGYYERDYCATM